MRSRVRVLLLSLSRRLRLCRKKFSSPPTPLCHESRDFLYVYDLVYSLGEFLAPPLLKITFCILSCRERSWHWPVKASGRIRSWNVEESSMKVSVLFGRSQGNNTTLMLKLRVGNQTKKYVLTFIRTNGRNATTRNGNNDNCQQHESKRGLHDGVIRLNNIQNLKDNTK